MGRSLAVCRNTCAVVISEQEPDAPQRTQNIHFQLQNGSA
jgi:hypothetical protein